MTPEALADALIPALEKLIAKHMAPLQEHIAQLEGAEVPTAEETPAEAARLLLGGDGIKSLIDLEMQAYVAANPPQKGEKGDPGVPAASFRVVTATTSEAQCDRDEMLAAGYCIGSTAFSGTESKATCTEGRPVIICVKR